MPVTVNGKIDNKAIELTIRDGTLKPIFLGGDDIRKLIVIHSVAAQRDEIEGLHFVAFAKLWLHRNGRPMGENESFGRRIKIGEDNHIGVGEKLKVTNPDNRENLITASYLRAQSRK